MTQFLREVHLLDSNDNLAGGHTTGIGLTIDWQNGPLGRGEDRHAQNGAFVEEVIQAALGRLEFYQRSQFHCLHNAVALGYMKAALGVLHERTQEREDRDVEGTHIT